MHIGGVHSHVTRPLVWVTSHISVKLVIKLLFVVTFSDFSYNALPQLHFLILPSALVSNI